MGDGLNDFEVMMGVAEKASLFLTRSCSYGNMRPFLGDAIVCHGFKVRHILGRLSRKRKAKENDSLCDHKNTYVLHGVIPIQQKVNNNN